MTLPGWVGVGESRGRLGGLYAKNVTICPTQACTTPPNPPAQPEAEVYKAVSLSTHVTRHTVTVCGRGDVSALQIVPPPPLAKKVHVSFGSSVFGPLIWDRTLHGYTSHRANQLLDEAPPPKACQSGVGDGCVGPRGFLVHWVESEFL